MKLLVTGGAGFIGSHFIRYWLKNHPEDFIVNLDALTYAASPATIEEFKTNSHYSFVHGSISDITCVDKCLQGIDWVINFAAETHVDNSIAEPDIFLQTNVIGTGVLLKSALKHNVKRFHHVSTDEVFGSLGPEGKFNFNSPYNPRSPYSASKAASDHLVRAYWHTYKLPITISNCSNNYGPFQFPEKFIPVCITNVILGKKIPVYGDGSNRRDWIYVLDHVKGIEAILLNGKAGSTYLLAGPDGDISNLAVVEKLLEIMRQPKEIMEFVTDRPGHDWRYALDDVQSRQELGWQPQVSWQDGLGQTVDWYQQNQARWRDILDNKN